MSKVGIVGVSRGVDGYGIQNAGVLRSGLGQGKSGQEALSKSFFDNRSLNDGRGYDPLLSPQDAAEYLGVKRKFIYERMARKEIEVQPLGRLKRIRLSALETWLLREKQRR